ncbi:hypothetical protein BJ170DRAFT_630925 [Xylariales sp. AK1849]|nr:hypothetical protein BJ170DRAFT_630925 [Xylariales sp. AK1849]
MSEDSLSKVERTHVSYQPVSDTSSETEQSVHHHGHHFAHEKNKSVIERGPGLLAYWIHILSVGCTAAVLQLSFRNVYWTDDNNLNNTKWSFGLNLGLDQEEVANILQFPAKLHEIFIVASLSAIIFSVIRRRLIGTRGVPFGFLMGGYQAGSVEYLFSGGFWGPFTHAIKHHISGVFGLGLFIGLGIVYANVVGPCSAVLIVPNLSWWDVPNPFNGQPLTSYTDAPREDLYPNDLAAPEPGAYDATCFTSNMTSTCPGAGNPDLQDLATAYANEGIAPNITMSQIYGRARRDLTAVHTSVDNDTVLVASSLHSDVTEVIGLFWHYVSTNAKSGLIYNIGRPQLQIEDPSNSLSAVVQVQCNPFDLYEARNGEVDVTFPTKLFSDYVVTDNKTGPPVPREYWDFSSQYNVTNFTWVDLQSVGWKDQTLSASIGALASVPYRNGEGSGEDVVRTQDTLLVACVLDARWAATEVTYDPTQDDTVNTNITDATLFKGATHDKDLRARYGLTNLITIDPAWAEMLNVPGITAQSKGGEILEVPAIEAILLPFVTNGTEKLAPHGGTVDDQVETEYRAFQPPTWDPKNDYDENTAETIATILSLAVADGLSRATYNLYNYDMVFDNSNKANYTMVNLLTQAGEAVIEPWYSSEDELSLDAWLPLTFTVKRYGWGYGTHTKTAKFAISVLLLHAAIAITYILYGLFHWAFSRWSSSAWGEVGEIFALAMLSSEPKALRGAGAGIDAWDTWKLDVMVRERGTERVELVFGDRNGGLAAGREGMVRHNEKYR